MITRRPIRSGFTLVEVLVVVSIIGIAGAIIVPQMLKAGTLQIQAAARMIISDLTIAQNEAVAQQAPRRAVFEVEQNRYRLADGNGDTITVAWKAGGAASANYVIDFANDSRFSGVHISKVDFNGTQTVEYDALGTPSHGGTIELVSGSTRYRITVAPFTGRITVAPVSGGS